MKEKEQAKQFLKKELKHHNFDGVIHYGSHGEKSIDVSELLQKYANELLKLRLREIKEKIEDIKTNHDTFFFYATEELEMFINKALKEL